MLYGFLRWYLMDEGMRQAGCREHETITRYEARQREPSLQIALKPAWRMTLC